MFPNKIRFTVGDRISFAKKEWYLRVEFLESLGSWVVKTYPEEPTKEIIEGDKKLIIRSMELYHRYIEKPSFKMEIV